MRARRHGAARRRIRYDKQSRHLGVTCALTQARRKEKERLKREQLRKEGKLLTGKAKEEAERRAAAAAALLRVAAEKGAAREGGQRAEAQGAGEGTRLVQPSSLRWSLMHLARSTERPAWSRALRRRFACRAALVSSSRSQLCCFSTQALTSRRRPRARRRRRRRCGL
jgi:hypothetical protein